MSVPVLPNIITGPGVIDHNGVFHYFKKNIDVEDITESFKIPSSAGDLDERFKSRITKITADLVGELRSSAYLLKIFPFGPADIGKSIFPANADDAVVKIYSIPEGKSYAWARGGVSEYDAINCSPTKTALGKLALNCIGLPETQPTDAAFWKTIADEAFADASFDDSTIITDIYKAVIGARLAPYNAVGSMTGFKIKPTLTTKPIPAEDIGIADIRVENLGLGLEFAPSNLTEAEVDALLGIQGSNALLVGQSFAKANEDIIIDSDAFTATLYKMGAKKWNGTYDAIEHRHKNLEFVSKRSGAIFSNANPLFLFEVN
jgi:hypothetical protein